MAGENTNSDFDKLEPTLPKKKPPISNLISPLLSTFFSPLRLGSPTFPQLSPSAQIQLDCQNRKITKAIARLEKLQLYEKQAQDKGNR